MLICYFGVVRFLNLVLLAIMAIICGVLDSVLQHRYYPRGALWLYGADHGGDNPSVNGLVTFVFALITYVAISSKPILGWNDLDVDGFIFFTGSRTLCQFPCTSQLSLCGHVKQRSFTLIPRCTMRKRDNRRWHAVGTCQMTSGKSSIFSRTRLGP